jgi:DNA-binding NarL/FixJ family response regulator
MDHWKTSGDNSWRAWLLTKQRAVRLAKADAMAAQAEKKAAEAASREKAATDSAAQTCPSGGAPIARQRKADPVKEAADRRRAEFLHFVKEGWPVAEIAQAVDLSEIGVRRWATFLKVKLSEPKRARARNAVDLARKAELLAEKMTAAHAAQAARFAERRAPVIAALNAGASREEAANATGETLYFVGSVARRIGQKDVKVRTIAPPKPKAAPVPKDRKPRARHEPSEQSKRLDEEIARLFASGLSDTKIGAIVGLSRSGVQRRRNEMGVFGASGAMETEIHRKIHELRAQGRTVRDIAAALGIAKSTASRIGKRGSCATAKNVE